MENTPRYALKFAYDGSLFEGYARQPGMDTVEGNAIDAMKDLGIIEDTKSAGFMSGSRTDKGVSAAGNVIAVRTGYNRAGMIPRLNSKLRGIEIRGIADVPDDFNPRHARQRHYRYFLLDTEDKYGAAVLNQHTSLFLGEHDFRHFIKKDSGNENRVLAIDDFRVSKAASFLIFEIAAHRFAWQLVRRLVQTTLALADGEVSPAGVVAALEEPEEHSLATHPMPASGLVLADVLYAFDFEFSEGEKQIFRKMGEDALLRARILSELARVPE